MGRIWLLLLVMVGLSGCARPVSAQESIPQRLERLQAEQAELIARAEALDEEITRLRAVVLGGGEAIAAARLNDAEHEFIAYPVYRFHSDSVHAMLDRIGYTTYHDAQHRIPRWVSQKLTDQWVSSPAALNRTSISWRTDPELTGIGARDSDYRNSGYSRGHMAMQQTLRGRSEEGERQGMYFGNAAPQRQEFNGGIWLQLENQTIQWAREHGQIWMICGPVITEGAGVIGTGVTVPARLFKIVARDTEDGVAVIAFMFDHEPDEPHGSLEDHIVSVRYIEVHTGLDFFSELPEEIQDVLETQRHAMSFDGTPLPTVAGGPDGGGVGPPPTAGTVYVTGTGRRYHRAECRYVRDGGTAMPLAEAGERYEPCSVCQPPR